MFEINNDLNKLKYKNVHNWVHLFGSTFLVILFSVIGCTNVLHAAAIAWSLGILWDIGDGFKPWFYAFVYDRNISKVKNKVRELLLYSDKFSLQDVFFWDLIGVLLGVLLLIIFK